MEKVYPKCYTPPTCTDLVRRAKRRTANFTTINNNNYPTGSRVLIFYLYRQIFYFGSVNPIRINTVMSYTLGRNLLTVFLRIIHTYTLIYFIKQKYYQIITARRCSEILKCLRHEYTCSLKMGSCFPRTLHLMIE